MSGRPAARAPGPGLMLLLAAAMLGAACQGGAEPPEGRRHVVEIRGFEYHPASLEVAAGDTVVWVNHDMVPHTATAADGGWDSGSIAAGESWERVAAAEGGGEYACTFHPGMTGRLAVR